MTQYLPPDLLALFAPRDPIPYLELLDKPVWDKKPWKYTGVAQCVSLFEVRSRDISLSTCLLIVVDVLQDPGETPAPTFPETKKERKERKVGLLRLRHVLANVWWTLSLLQQTIDVGG